MVETYSVLNYQVSFPICLKFKSKKRSRFFEAAKVKNIFEQTRGFSTFFSFSWKIRPETGLNRCWMLDAG